MVRIQQKTGNYSRNFTPVHRNTWFYWANFVKNSNSLPPLAAKSTIGQPFIELSEVESTNIYAMERVQANLAVHGTTLFAHHQTGGKGQRGKSWESQPGSQIAMTVITDCSFLFLANPFPLSVMSALACHDFFSSFAPEETYIKWPNDLYWRDRKAGGILIENQIRGNIWQWSVIGIGININQTHFPESLNYAVSLKQITGKSYSIVEMAKTLCGCLEHRYQQLKKGCFAEQLAAYNQQLYKTGQNITLKKNKTVMNGKLKGVSATGELMFSGDTEEQFRFGEVEWIRD